METITMSSKEISRLEVMQKLREKRLSQKEASTGVSVRQIKRLLKSYRQAGAKGLVSKQHGGKGNNQQTRQSEVVMAKDLGAQIKERLPFKPPLTTLGVR